MGISKQTVNINKIVLGDKAKDKIIEYVPHGLNHNIYTQHCKSNTVIMHPLPRDSREQANELDNDLNSHPSLAIFRQADNGLLIRMALFALVLDVVDKVDDFSREVHWYNSRQQ